MCARDVLSQEGLLRVLHVPSYPRTISILGSLLDPRILGFRSPSRVRLVSSLLSVHPSVHLCVGIGEIGRGAIATCGF